MNARTAQAETAGAKAQQRQEAKTAKAACRGRTGVRRPGEAEPLQTRKASPRLKAMGLAAPYPATSSQREPNDRNKPTNGS